MLTDWEFVVFLDAEMALTKVGKDFVMLAQASPRIGFLTRDEHQLREEERAVLEGLFGPVLLLPTTPTGLAFPLPGCGRRHPGPYRSATCWTGNENKCGRIAAVTG